jgi:2-polyprenyl-6-methoxyphenol hydroxylase-like FAD-dependent oxidoreductase
METTLKTDVIIVGAGPTGLALACQLIRYGVDFLILDRKETTTPYSKAIGVQARTLEVYEQIGLADELIKAGAIAERARLLEGGEVRGEVELGEIGKGMSPYPYLLIVEQGTHEKILYDFIKSHGHEILWQAELESFSQTADRVTARVKGLDGAVQTVEAKFLVGCDGAKSIVRRTLGLEFEGSTFERLFYVADVEIDWEFSHDALMVCLAQNTITAFFPMLGENRYRIVGTFPENHTKDEGEILYEEIEAQIKADTELNLDIKGVHWFSVYKVHSRRVNRFSQGRCFLAGDSAHIHTPAGAQGMNTGIQDGYNLAWKLALSLRGKLSAKTLESYNEERVANASRLLETTDRLFSFGASEEWFVAYVRTHIFPYVANFALQFDTVRKLIFPLISQIGITYRDSSLSRHNGDAEFKVKAGDRMPYFKIDGASIYDRLRAPRFHLLIFSNRQSEYQSLQTELEKDYSDWIDFNLIGLEPTVSEIFGTDEPLCLLLRPDNYIGFISPTTSLEEMSAYLIEIAGRS